MSTSIWEIRCSDCAWRAPVLSEQQERAITRCPKCGSTYLYELPMSDEPLPGRFH